MEIVISNHFLCWFGIIQLKQPLQTGCLEFQVSLKYFHDSPVESSPSRWMNTGEKKTLKIIDQSGIYHAFSSRNKQKKTKQILTNVPRERDCFIIHLNQPLIFKRHFCVQESKSRAMENFRKMGIIPRAWVEVSHKLNLAGMAKKRNNRNFPPDLRVFLRKKGCGFCWATNEIDAEKWRDKLRFHWLEVMISSSGEVWQAPATSDHALGFLSGFILGVHPRKLTWNPKIRRF